MKRDDDYIRQLLLNLEASEETHRIFGMTLTQSDEEEKEFYHVQLLCDAGLMTETQRGIFRMTNQGHDFVAAVRSDTIWTKTKAGASQIGGATLAILKDLAVSYLKLEAKKTLGIDLP